MGEHVLGKWLSFDHGPQLAHSQPGCKSHEFHILQSDMAKSELFFTLQA